MTCRESQIQSPLQSARRGSEPFCECHCSHQDTGTPEDTGAATAWPRPYCFSSTTGLIPTRPQDVVEEPQPRSVGSTQRQLLRAVEPTRRGETHPHVKAQEKAPGEAQHSLAPSQTQHLPVVRVPCPAARHSRTAAPREPPSLGTFEGAGCCDCAGIASSAQINPRCTYCNACMTPASLNPGRTLLSAGQPGRRLTLCRAGSTAVKRRPVLRGTCRAPTSSVGAENSV